LRKLWVHCSCYVTNFLNVYCLILVNFLKFEKMLFHTVHGGECWVFFNKHIINLSKHQRVHQCARSKKNLHNVFNCILFTVFADNPRSQKKVSQTTLGWAWVRVGYFKGEVTNVIPRFKTKKVKGKSQIQKLLRRFTANSPPPQGCSFFLIEKQWPAS